MYSCGACQKTYSSAYTLKKHLVRQPLCQRWLDLVPGVKDYVDDKFRLPKAPTESETTCGVCGETYANVGNLNRHLDSSVVCSKWAMYRDLEPLQAYVGGRKYQTAPEALPCAFHHIIWNVYLTDKEAARGTNLKDACAESKVGYVIAILPEGEDAAFSGVEVTVLRYSGHEAHLDADAFDVECGKIEDLRRERRNVLVFCNSGYQRSVPFLCHYLVKHHGDEVPTVARAIDIIMPQVDKAGFSSDRNSWIERVETLFGESRVKRK